MKVYVVSQGYTPIGVYRDRETALAVSKGANGALFGGEDDCHVHEFPVVEESQYFAAKYLGTVKKVEINDERD